jgi:hypothetical protein
MIWMASKGHLYKDDYKHLKEQGDDVELTSSRRYRNRYTGTLR